MPGIHPALSRPRPARASRSGFALLITITLVAFLVLLLVSFAAFTRVETRVAGNMQDAAQARQNALMALNMALGELQRAAGPDQRATASAALGDSATGVSAANAADNGLVAPSVGARHWTGVWGNKDAPEALFTAAPRPVLLRWLVSGNENAPAITAAADGNITAPALAAALAFTPDLPVTPALTSAITALSPLLIGGAPAALLVGPASTDGAPAAFVAAPLRDIEADALPGLSGPARIGRYAWWIGDEGVKARFNLGDAYQSNATPDDADTEDSRLSRYRVLASQRNGIELMSAFAGSHYPLTGDAPDSPAVLRITRTLYPGQLSAAVPGLGSTALRRHAHDLTTQSLGVLSDSQFGGLRRDLTFHLDSRSADTFLDGRNILPDGATPVSSYSGSKYTARPSLFSETVANGGLGHASLDVSPRLGPKWDQLKSFYRTSYDMPADLAPRPAVDIGANPVVVQSAITPVILEARTVFALRAGPAIDTSFIVILGNPYSRPLTAPDGLNVRMALHPTGHDASKYRLAEFGLVCRYQEDPASTATPPGISVFTRKHTPAASISYYPILKFGKQPGGGLPDPDADHPGVLDRVLFQIPPGVLNLAPGEARAYHVAPGSRPDETVDGESFTVVPLQEMTESYAPVWISHACDPHYLAAHTSFPSDMWTGGAIPSGAFFLVGNVAGNEATVSYTLTLPGKPESVLQMLGPVRLYSPANLQPGDAGETMFAETRTPVVGERSARYFGREGGQTYTGESLPATHADANMLGAWQIAQHHTAGLNPRHQLRLQFTSWHYDGSPDTWLNDFFIDGLDAGTAVQAAWGEGNAGNPVRFAPRGRLVVNDAPAALSADEVPVLSLAQLQHADLTADDEALGVSTQPGNALGNSRYNRFVPRAASRTAPMGNHRSLRFGNSSDSSSAALGDSPWWYDGYVPDLPKSTLIRRYDISYLLNTALWDGTFFSTIIPASGSDSAPAPRPANRRLVYLGDMLSLGQLRGSDSSSVIPDPAALAPGENGRVPAARLLVNGAFNVNSTSAEAWIAVLSGLRGLAVGDASATETHTPFARSIRQPGLAQAGLPAGDAAARAAEATHAGFRALTDDQLRTLADEIVTQVRARGPFLSLAQFVNRHLTPAAAPGDLMGDTSLAGALQQAIDRTDINASLNKNSSIPRALAASPPNDRHTEYPDNAFMPEGAASGLSTYMGHPGWLSQADVLQALAPSLAARSDTFVIRAYGETLDPVNSPAAPAAPVVKARAWCEAVVQRLPGYMDDSDSPTLHPSLANTENRTFGRRFHIVSFRWLSPDDI